MAINRRQALLGTFSLLVAGYTGGRQALADLGPAASFLDKSGLIYLTPIKSNGENSRCQAEVWFVHHGGDVYVVTKSDAWRTEALRRGLTRARIWIGEFGPWTSAKGQYLSAPTLVVTGAIEQDTNLQADVLNGFGAKYASEWGTWGPRFRDGLSDGSRAMLRYRLDA